MRGKKVKLIRNLLLMVIMVVFILLPSGNTAKANDEVKFDYGTHYLGKNSYAYRMVKWVKNQSSPKFLSGSDINHETGRTFGWPDIEIGEVVNNMVFAGWYADTDFTEPRYNDQYYSTAMTLYARWKFNVTYDAGEGNYINNDYYYISGFDSSLDGDNKLVRTAEGSYYIDTTRVAHYKDDTKAFIGWKYKGTIIDNDTLGVGVNTTLEAEYTDAYKITFDANSSTAKFNYYLETYNKDGDYNNNKVNLDQDKFTITYPKGVNPKDADYMSSWPFYTNTTPLTNTDTTKIFKEWNTKADGSGETVYDFYNYSPKKDGTDTIYAIWSGYNTVTIDGGDKSITPITFRVVKGRNVGSDAYRYVSSGYYRSSKFKNDAGVYLSSSYVPTNENEVFHAVDWYEVYTVHIDLDGGKYLSESGNLTTESTYWECRGDSQIGTIYSSKVVQLNSNNEIIKIGKGWSTDEAENRSTPVKATDKVSSLASSGSHDVWVYPIWDSNVATATFVVGAESGDAWGSVAWYGGKNVTQYSVPYIKGTVIGEAPVIPDYVNNDDNDETGKQFRGWRRKDSSELVNLSKFAIGADETFYAEYADTVTVSYYSKGKKYHSEHVEKGIKYSISDYYAPFNEDGQAFVGWSDKESSTTALHNGATFTANQPMSFYAVWEQGYEITFIGNGGEVYGEGHSSSNTSKAVVTIQRGKPVLSGNDEWESGLVHVYRDGDYLLRGWSLTSDGDVVDLKQYTPTSNTTFYAIWAPSVDVKFVDGYGKELATKTLEKGKSLELFPEVTMSSGQAVDGWYKDPTFATPMTLTEAITEDTVVYAKVTTDVWTVTFDAGSGDSVIKATTSHYSSYYGDKTLEVSIPKNKSIDVSAYKAAISDSKEVFMGWTASGLDWTCGTSGGTFTPSCDVTITAKFGKGYEVTFDGSGKGVIPMNGDTPEQYTMNVSPGQAIGESVYAIPKDGTSNLEFTGWYLANKTKVGDEKTIASYKPNGNVVLYAGWKDGTVTVTGVILDKSMISIGVGEEYQLEANVIPSNASNKNIEYSSSDTTLATVDANGLIKAADKKDGVEYPKEVTITAVTKDQGKTVTCKVTITSITSAQVITNVGDLADGLKTNHEYIDNPSKAKEDIDKMLKGLGGADMLAGKVDTNNNVKEKLGDLDSTYKDVAGIEVNMPMAKELKDALGSDITVSGNLGVVGAALNANPNSTVEITVEATKDADKKTIDETKFTDATQIDIGLKVTDANGSTKTLTDNLVSPVTLTLPLPSSRIKNKLYILHYNEETDEYEIVRPKFVGNSMEFTVSHFSTFVLVHLTEGTAIGDSGSEQNPDNPADPQGGGSGNGGSNPQGGGTGNGATSNPSAAIGTTTEVGGGVYVVSGDSEVTFKNVKDKKAKKVKIDEKVSIDGKEYTVTAIASGAFKNCKKLTSVTIPSSITTIGANAFSGCVELKKVTIPASVTSIGKNAFKGCKKLGKITIKSTKITSIGKNAFKGIKKGATIKVPKSKKKDYTKLLKKAKLPSGVKIK